MKRRLSVKTLLSQARKEPKREVYVSAVDMGAVINTLHDKGLSWKEIADWCAKRGYKWSGTNCKAGWVQWRKRRGLKSQP